MGYYYAMCWKCGKGIALDGPAGRSMVCATCGADVRSCKNCGFFSPGSYHDCAERVEDAVRDKERANFCDSFRLKPEFRVDHAPAGRSGVQPRGATSGGKGDDSARSAFDSLFDK